MKDEYIRSLIGKTKEDAIAKLNHDGMEWRIVAEGNEYYMVTSDWRPHRVDLEIDDGLVVDASIG